MKHWLLAAALICFGSSAKAATKLGVTLGATSQPTSFSTGFSASTSPLSNISAIQVQSDNTVRFQAGGSTVNARGPLTLFSLGTSSGMLANTNYQDLGTYVMPAGVMQNVGDVIYVVCMATMTSMAADNKAYSPTFGNSNLLNQTDNINTGSATGILAYGWITKTGPSTQRTHAHNEAGAGTGWNQRDQAFTVTDTAPITITCRGSGSTGNANEIITESMVVQYWPAP